MEIYYRIVYELFFVIHQTGKTNYLLTLLTHPNGLRFENINMYSKSRNQPKYKFLEKVLQTVNEIEYFPFNEHEEVVQPNEE